MNRITGWVPRRIIFRTNPARSEIGLYLERLCLKRFWVSHF